MPEDMSEYMPEDMSDRMPEDMSEYMPEDMPDRMPEDMSDRVPEDMPDRMPEDLPDRMPEDMPEDMPDHMPEDMPDRMSNRMSEDMSDRMPEDLPVRKCINVMVGITRSKVIYLHRIESNPNQSKSADLYLEKKTLDEYRDISYEFIWYIYIHKISQICLYLFIHLLLINPFAKTPALNPTSCVALGNRSTLGILGIPRHKPRNVLICHDISIRFNIFQHPT